MTTKRSSGSGRGSRPSQSRAGTNCLGHLIQRCDEARADDREIWKRGMGRTSTRVRGSRPYNQRCAVRVIYSRNTVRGQWGAHGRYVARESATHEIDGKTVGFDQKDESIDISVKLDGWQKAGDERMWKFIISPEFGEQINLNRLTRDLMTRVGRDLGIRRSRVDCCCALQHRTPTRSPGASRGRR